MYIHMKNSDSGIAAKSGHLGTLGKYAAVAQYKMHTGPIELRTVAQKTTQISSGFELPIMMVGHTRVDGVE